MTTCSIQFIAGRYHATPWGHHVNEGMIDWPPSPWRLLRALLAVGFAKHGWTESDGVPAVGLGLIEKLAAVLPLYRLPTGSASHIRHYMPIRDGRSEKTTKVIDAFLVCDRGAELQVYWPVDLGDSERDTLARLLGGLSYLGRAESWCEARLLDDDAEIDETWCGPDPQDGSAVPAGLEQVPVLSPVSGSAYLAWRAAQPPPPRQPKGRPEFYPQTLIHALCRSTSELRAAGWSQPPGSRVVLYRRPSDCFEPATPRPFPAPSRREPVEAALLALASDDQRGTLLPRAHRALPLAEKLHQAFGSIAQAEAIHSPTLAGRDASGAPLVGHRHATLLPLDNDRDGRIDHVMVYAPSGLDEDAQRVLARVYWTYGKDLPRIRIVLAGTGARKDMTSALTSPGHGEPKELGRGTLWETATPFVAPRFIKRGGKNTLERQIVAECLDRGLPEPSGLRVWSTEECVARGFLKHVRARGSEARQPPTTRPWGLSLRFAHAVEGPITLGYAAHFGLGMLRRVDEPLDL